MHCHMRLPELSRHGDSQRHVAHRCCNDLTTKYCEALVYEMTDRHTGPLMNYPMPFGVLVPPRSACWAPWSALRCLKSTIKTTFLVLVGPLKSKFTGNLPVATRQSNPGFVVIFKHPNLVCSFQTISHCERNNGFSKTEHFINKSAACLVGYRTGQILWPTDDECWPTT